MDKFTNAIPFGGRGITWKVAISYVLDYAIIAVLAAVYAALDKILTPFAQHFSLNNITIQYPMVSHERVPIFMAIVISCGGPTVIIAFYTLVIDGLFSKSRKNVSRSQRYTWGDRLWELNCGILGLFLAQGAAFCITGSLKNLIGKPRPDFISRCLPRPGSEDGTPFGLSNKSICTQTDGAIMQDGFRSFPSGHSSSSFAGLFYLSLYLAAKLHVFDQRGEVWRTFIIIVPTMGAALIAGSRIMDSRHHPFDVLFGSLLGILCAWGAYRQYFPPLSHTWEKGRAYPMRTWGVPMRRPDGVMGSDGQVYNYGTGKVDRTANAMADYEREDEEERDKNYLSMEPIRPKHDRVHSPGSAEDTDYEHVRLNAGAGPYEGTSRELNSPGGSNAFRDQVNRNQAARVDEGDIANTGRAI